MLNPRLWGDDEEPYRDAFDRTTVPVGGTRSRYGSDPGYFDTDAMTEPYHRTIEPTYDTPSQSVMPKRPVPDFATGGVPGVSSPLSIRMPGTDTTVQQRAPRMSDFAQPAADALAPKMDTLPGNWEQPPPGLVPVIRGPQMSARDEASLDLGPERKRSGWGKVLDVAIGALSGAMGQQVPEELTPYGRHRMYTDELDKREAAIGRARAEQQANEDREAERVSRGIVDQYNQARAASELAEAQQRLTPRMAPPTKFDVQNTDQGLVWANPETRETFPFTVNGQQAHAYEKPLAAPTPKDPNKYQIGSQVDQYIGTPEGKAELDTLTKQMLWGKLHDLDPNLTPEAVFGDLKTWQDKAFADDPTAKAVIGAMQGASAEAMKEMRRRLENKFGAQGAGGAVGTLEDFKQKAAARYGEGTPAYQRAIEAFTRQGR